MVYILKVGQGEFHKNSGPVRRLVFRIVKRIREMQRTSEKVVTKWTPGPWEAIKDEAETINIVCTCPEHERRCSLAGMFYVGHPEHVDANAQLMASAPMLYEACKKAYEVAVFQGWKDTAWAKKLATALSTAEGN